MFKLFKRQIETKAITLDTRTQDIIRAALPPQQFFNLNDPQPAKYKKFLSQYTNWVYVCASRNAATVASIPLRLYSAGSVKPKVKELGRVRDVSRETKSYLNSKSHLGPLMGGGEVEEVIVHPWLELIRKVNDFTNGFEMIEQMVLQLELTGNAYWHILLDPSDIPMELWTLQSHLVTIKKSERSAIDYYEFGTRDPLLRLETEEVAHFTYPNPLDIFYGMGPLEASQLPVILNTRFKAFENSVLENGAVIPFILSTEQSPNEDATTRLRAAIDKVHKGFLNAGKWLMLTSGLKPITVGSRPKDINYEIGLKMTMGEICGAFGVPVSMVTTSDVNRSNAEVGLEQYMRFTILPKLKRIEQVINQNIMPFYDDNIFVAFDDPVPVHKAFNLEEATARLNNQSMTINEYREGMGEDSVEWGDEPLVQGDFHSLSDRPEPVDPLNEFPDDELDEKGRRVTKVQTLADGSPTASLVIQDQTQKWLNTTAIVTIGNVSSVQISNENVIDSFVPWPEIEADGIEKLKVPLTDTLHSGAERGVQRMRRLSISTSAWDIQNPGAIRWAEKYVGDRITLINNQTKLAVREAVVEALRQGKSQQELQRAIKQHIGLNGPQARALANRELKLRAGGATEQQIKANTDVYRGKLLKQRAEMIARTETAAAWAEGNIQSYREAGVEYKEFSSANDACDICSPLDGKVYPVGSREQVIPKHVNCRCDWLPVIDSPVIAETV